MFIEPTKDQIETVPEIKNLYDNYVNNGESNIVFEVSVCDRCGKIFDSNMGWTLQHNINYMDCFYDICEECGRNLVVNNIKLHKKTDFYNSNF